ncbi:MAG TPA: hypothetical protein VHW25_11805 [Steroidobacteraceae bacterium]|jgi:hypothetical protein|nr:hypothetical protein [Steroidobacteraceae bacterium]
MKQLSAIGIYSTATQAEVGVDMLVTKGFKSAGISVLLPEHPNTQPAAPGTSAVARPTPQTTKTGSASAVGATAGGALFGALAMLAGAGALAIPGIGPFIAAGPLMAGLAGLGVGGAVGGLGGALVGMGLPEDEAKRYLSRIGSGHTLVVVHCDTPAEGLKAKDILTTSGAAEVSVSNEPIAV